MNNHKKRYQNQILAKKRLEKEKIKKMDFSGITKALKDKMEEKKDINHPFG